ncbi:hypothetical protein CAEBREN_05401 [Caenorhabditis brenneri]|uniref:Uncharacterized protein n=1 Tax=Caenorhabditis brenneri TaxID=135651 RepID=G0NSU5_CAEBE|nr:hypothetical protein CAEBREN_05401 [Caenorhabditis brenneri]
MNEPNGKNQEFQGIPVIVGSPSRRKPFKSRSRQLVEVRLRDMVQPYNTFRSLKEEPVVKLKNCQITRLNQEIREAEIRDEMFPVLDSNMPLPPIQHISIIRMERPQGPFTNFCQSYLEKHPQCYRTKPKEVIVIDDDDESNDTNEKTTKDGKTGEKTRSKMANAPAIKKEVEGEDPEVVIIEEANQNKRANNDIKIKHESNE